MLSMKHFTLPFVILACLTTSAYGKEPFTYVYDTYETSPDSNRFAKTVSQPGSDAEEHLPTDSTENEPIGHGKIVMLPIMDTKRNMVSARIPLPTGWKFTVPKTADDPNIVGPHGIKVYYRTGGFYSYSQDPQMQQMYQMSGQTMRAPLTARQIVEQDLISTLRDEGLYFVKQYPLPQVAHRSQVYRSKLYKSMPSQDSFDAAGAEWTDKNGTSLFVIVDQSVNSGQGSIFWAYQLKALEAPKEYFETAKKAFIYGIVNTEDNPQQIQAYNRSEQQKANQSWSEHNARMQQNQKNFDRQQQIHRSTSDAINNSIMESYRTQQESSDRGQQRFNNYLRDEETVTNPYDGEQYQVESGADQYWMNRDGQSIQSNDAFYNPNVDNEVNYQEWLEVEPE